MGPPPLSASQIRLYRDCPERWRRRYILGMVEPETPAQALGKAVHRDLEGWLGEGTPIPLGSKHGRIAGRAFHLLPTPGSGTVEGPFRFELNGIQYRGMVDYSVAGKPPLIVDHKTSKAPEPVELAEDVQALIYARWGVERWRSDRVRLRWIYFPTTTNGGEPFPVDATLRKPLIVSGFRDIERTGRAILEQYRQPEEPLTKNPDACFQWGRCPHIESCWQNGGDEMGRPKGSKNKSKRAPVIDGNKKVDNDLQAAIARANSEEEEPEEETEEEEQDTSGILDQVRALGSRAGQQPKETFDFGEDDNGDTEEESPANQGPSAANVSALQNPSAPQQSIVLQLTHGAGILVIPGKVTDRDVTRIKAAIDLLVG